MPMVIAAAVVGGLASASAGAIVAGTLSAFTLSAFATGFVTSLIVGVASKALAPKAKAVDQSVSMTGRTVAVRSPVAPREIVYGMVRKSGTIVYVNSNDANGGHMNVAMVIALAGHECAAIGDVYLDDYTMWTDSNADLVTYEEKGRYNVWVPGDVDAYVSHVHVTRFFGAANQPAVWELVHTQGGQWTENHRLSNTAGIALFLIYNQDLYPNGVPNPSAIVYGKKVYDPRTGLTAWSDNPALCIADYLCDTEYGLAETYADGIYSAELITAANICDETVTKADGTTEKRYTLNGFFSCDAEPQAILGSMLTAMAGKLVRIGGKWKIYAGAYVAPTVALDEDDFLAIKVATRISRAELFNSVKGTFISPDNSWQPTGLPPVISSSAVAEDGGEVIWKAIELPWTISGSMAQRLAKIDIMRMRQQITVQARCRLTAYLVQPGDTVQISIAHYGWDEKVFEVQSSTLNFEEEGAITVDLVLRETASNVYSWTSAEEMPIDAAPDTNLPDPFTIPSPDNFAAIEETYVTRDGLGVKTGVALSWVEVASPYVTEYEYGYRLWVDTDLFLYPTSRATSAFIEDLAPGDYAFAVRSISYQGVRSGWTTQRVQVRGLADPPSELTGFSLVNMGGFAYMTWEQSIDIDVRVGGTIYIRHHPATSGSPTWAEATQIGNPVPGDSVQAIVPLKLGTYMIRAYDGGGRGGPVATFSTEGATVLAYSTLSTLTEHTSFSGTKTDTVVSGGILSLDATGDFSTIPLLSDVPSVASYGGIIAEGSYAFNTTMDLGSLRRVRVRSHILATITSVVDTVGSRIAPISEWQSFIGLDGDEADAWVEFRDTATDPTGSPTWTEWRRLDASEIRAWGLQFRAQLRSYDANYNIEISELSAVAENI